MKRWPLSFLSKWKSTALPTPKQWKILQWHKISRWCWSDRRDLKKLGNSFRPQKRMQGARSRDIYVLPFDICWSRYFFYGRLMFPKIIDGKIKEGIFCWSMLWGQYSRMLRIFLQKQRGRTNQTVEKFHAWHKSIFHRSMCKDRTEVHLQSSGDHVYGNWLIYSGLLWINQCLFSVFWIKPSYCTRLAVHLFLSPFLFLITHVPLYL